MSKKKQSDKMKTMLSLSRYLRSRAIMKHAKAHHREDKRNGVVGEHHAH